MRLFADGMAEFTAFAVFDASEFTAATVDVAAAFTAPRAEFAALKRPFVAAAIVVVDLLEFPVVNMGPILCILKITNGHPEECLVFVYKNALEMRRSRRRSEFRPGPGSGTQYRIPMHSVHS